MNIDFNGLTQTGLAAFGLWLFKRITDSIEELNVRIAVLCEKINSHDNRITRLEDDA